MRTVICFSARTRPSPRHFLHGEAMIVPSPEHVEQGATLITWPKNDRWARLTSPLPPQVAHTVGEVPVSAPLPSQRSHGSSNFTVTVFSTPVATSTSVSGIG